MNNLRQESGTASNIKSRATRHNVQDAIEKVMQRLKLFREVPPTGLAIFCGAIPYGPPGSEKMEIYALVPPEPISVYFYRCDSRFHLEPLLDMIREKGTYGLMVIDGSGATYATLKGKMLAISKSITSGISSKHRAGGQSARRFERLREAEVNEYYKRAGGYANKIFLNIPDLKGIILGGPGPTKHDFLAGDHLQYTLKDKLLSVVDTAYTEEQGAKEVVRKAPEILKGVRYVEERDSVQSFLKELGGDTGKVTYGIEEVKKHLEAGLVKIVLISEGLDLVEVSSICLNCNHSEKSNVKQADLLKFETELTGKPCPKCNSSSLQLAEKKDLIDFFTELAERANTNAEMISVSHEEGEMLLKSFGGIAAILRYKT